ncbi:rhamnosyltransferase WsaF family glycosyltransferase [Collinsella bouchesdurhonensis]|uniref:rhamnosyltransferase WsaF family glycosyltransferase n=1 Tax=Collinsella bouchesdurhonensis TaxID=1907654 RepID=UPI003F8F234B
MNKQDGLVAAWYVPIPTMGGGGFRTILQNASALSCRGYRNDFYVIPPVNKALDLLFVEESCLEWFGMAPDRWLLAGANEEDRTLSVATSWDTVEYLVSSSHGAPGFYFVQDYEPWFFSLDSNFLAAENTYRHGLQVVTIGKWLAGKIDREYGSVLGYTDFGVGPAYYPMESDGRESAQPSPKHAVCAIYQPEKGRRVSPLLMEAIRVALALDPSLTFYLYGSDVPVPISDSRVVSLGLISTDECRELYWRCQCGVSLSISNPSRIPFEMMACGLPVIDLYRENNLFDFRDGSLLLARSDAASLATAIVSLAADREKQDSLRKGGLNLVAERTVALESDCFANLVCSDVGAGGFDGASVRQAYTCAPVEASDEALAVERRLIEESHRSRVEACVPVIWPDSGICVSFTSFEPVGDARLAVWSSGDQSDLRWFQMDGSDADFQVFVDREDGWDVGCRTYNFHFYINASKGESVFAGSAVVPLSPNASVGKVEAAAPILGGEVRIAEAPIPGCACDASSSEANGAVSGARETFSQRLKAWMNRCMKDGAA